jgi:hypothetical protein
MQATLVGALVGGAFTLLGGWFALRWQNRNSMRAVAAALLAEIRVADTMLEKQGVDKFYQQILDHWKETGRVEDSQTLVDMFDRAPEEGFPVYYAMAPQLGLLPHETSAAVVEYHAMAIGLITLVVRFVGKRQLDPATVKVLAHSIEAQWLKQRELRRRLMVMLAKLCEADVGTAGS